MSKLAYGPASKHILSSQGPSANNLGFYSTTYSTTYKNEGAESGIPCRHKGTGYIANFRPAIYYSSEQDDIDNPPMRELLKDNYDTHTKKHFVKHRVPDPNDILPSRVIPGLSGFAQNMNPTLPTQREVKDVHVDTRLGGSMPVYPRHRPILHSINEKDLTAKENGGYGPKSMSTESNAHYVKKPIHQKDVTMSDHSRIEPSGFTEACNVEPLTFRPFENHSGELPGYMTWRPTGRSMMSKDFKFHRYMSGNEPLQALSSRAELSNGYVKGNMADSGVQPKAAEKVGYPDPDMHLTHRQKLKKDDPTAHSVLLNPNQYTTLKSQHFQGQQRLPRAPGKEAVGALEPTGFTENNLPLVAPQESESDRGRYSTHYKTRFADPTLRGSARLGYVTNGGGVQPPALDAYTKSTMVHTFGPPDPGIRTLHPYTARSMMKRYPFLNDRDHSHKEHSILASN